MASKKNTTKTAAPTATKTAAAPAPAPAKPPVSIDKAIASMSMEQLSAQFEARREQEVTNLKSQIEKADEVRESLAKRLADLTGTLVKRARKGGATGPRGPRAKNAKPLAEYLHEVLKAHGVAGGTGAKEAEALLKAHTDWKSNAKNAYMSIFTALSKNGELFVKDGRGKFSAK